MKHALPVAVALSVVLAGCSKDSTAPIAAAFVSVQAGTYHACGLTPNGTAQCWGKAYYGGLGHGIAIDTSNVPRPVSGGVTFASLTLGNDFSCGLTPAGSVYCWGYFASGSASDSWFIQRPAPSPVAGGLTFASLVSGAADICGLTPVGAAYCWGVNYAGQDGAPRNSSPLLTPYPVPGGLVFQSVSTNLEVTCGLTAGGVAYCWGLNENGALGVDSSLYQSNTPVAVSGGLTFASLTTGPRRACGVTAAGAVYCWGFRMGGDFLQNAFAPQLVQSTVAFRSVSSGLGTHVCALTPAGAAYCWGPNARGELGTTAATSGCAFSPCSNVPVPVAGGLTFAELSTGGAGFTCGVTPTHEAYCWGEGSLGELGGGLFGGSPVPTRVSSPQP